MRNKRAWKKAILGCLVLALGGCAALDRVRPQALSPDDDDLSAIEDNLVLMSIDIHQRETRLRLRRLVVQNLQTQEFWVSVFFYNAVIGSNELPYKLKGNVTEYLVLMDIPAGSYRITKADFARSRINFSGGSDTRVLEDELGQKVEFEVVAGKPTYLGNLKIDIVRPTSIGLEQKNPSILLENESLWEPIPGLRAGLMNASTGMIQTLGGVLVYSTPGSRDNDLREAVESYPALEGVDFVNRSLSIEQ